LGRLNHARTDAFNRQSRTIEISEIALTGHMDGFRAAPAYQS